MLNYLKTKQSLRVIFVAGSKFPVILTKIIYKNIINLLEGLADFKNPSNIRYH